MSYCPPNITFSDIWVKNGVSHCFLDTVTSSTYGIFLLVFGIAQWLMYRKFATPALSIRRPKSHLMRLQLFLLAFMPVLAGVQLLLRVTLYSKQWSVRFIFCVSEECKIFYLCQIASYLFSRNFFPFLVLLCLATAKDQVAIWWLVFSLPNKYYEINR